MIKIAGGIKIATSVAPGPEGKLLPTQNQKPVKLVNAKLKPSVTVTPAVTGATYTPAMPG
jgi:hypothetical protein